MTLCDVNILVYAHRSDAQNHAAYKKWLEELITGDGTFAVSELVLSGFIRIVTHPKIFNPPSSLEDALSFINLIRDQDNCLIVSPGTLHWDIFQKLCTTANAKGNLVPDAYHAALAIESGCEWVTSDKGFSRYPDLKWRTPF